MTDPELEQILARTVRVIAEIRRRQAALSKRWGVTLLQYTAIHALRELGPVNITALARALHLNQSTVSSLVDRMERDGLVRRLASTKDRRSVKLRLTDRADAIAERVAVSPFELFRLLLGSLSAEERRMLGRIIEKIERALDVELTAIDRKNVVPARR